MSVKAIPRLISEEVGENLYKVTAGGFGLQSNKTIAKAFETFGNGAIDVANTVINSSVVNKESSMNLAKSFENTFKSRSVIKDGIEEKAWDVGRMASAGFIAGAGMRVATGGGLYRDGSGSQDIIGIPFI